MRCIIILLLSLVITRQINAEIFQVGVDKPYSSPNALYLANVIEHGDTIEIDAGTYIGQQTLAVWSKNNLLIRGVGGRPLLVANGHYIWGKGIWVVGGNNCTIEHIAFTGATVPDNNGAGIRLDGTGITIRHCLFHHNENGILTSNPHTGDIIIEFCEFHHNGYGDGYSHNLYIGHVDNLIFRFNYSHHAVIGHNLKSRAKNNYILYNRIMDEETGTASRLVDISNGGFALVMGNVLMQGTEAVNNNLLGYGLEGLSSQVSNELYLVNNTFVNKRVYSCIFLHNNENTEIVLVSNNIFAGSGTIVNGITTSFDNNLIETDIDLMHFQDESNYLYQLTDISPAVDFGIQIGFVNGISLTPEFEYIHPVTYQPRTISNNVVDAGAYEFQQPTDITRQECKMSALVFPNPSTGMVNFHESLQGEQVQIIQSDGTIVISSVIQKNYVDLSQLAQGIYYLKILNSKIPIIRIVKVLD